MSATDTIHLAAYNDRFLTVDAAGITVRWYGFPFGTKSIAWSDVVAAERRRMGAFTGQWRIWGSGDFKHWYHLDPHRPSKDVSFALQLRTGRTVPVLTPSDPAAFERALREHGVTPALVPQ
jgi:hypothetical protein